MLALGCLQPVRRPAGTGGKPVRKARVARCVARSDPEDQSAASNERAHQKRRAPWAMLGGIISGAVVVRTSPQRSLSGPRSCARAQSIIAHGPCSVFAPLWALGWAKACVFLHAQLLAACV